MWYCTHSEEVSPGCCWWTRMGCGRPAPMPRIGICAHPALLRLPALTPSLVHFQSIWWRLKFSYFPSVEGWCLWCGLTWRKGLVLSPGPCCVSPRARAGGQLLEVAVEGHGQKMARLGQTWSGQWGQPHFLNEWTQSRCWVMRPFAESWSPYCSSWLVQGFVAVAVFVNTAVMSLTGSPNLLMAGPCQLMADRWLRGSPNLDKHIASGLGRPAAAGSRVADIYDLWRAKGDQSESHITHE